MAQKRSRSGIGIFSIIFWIIVGYSFFHDSNDDKKTEVEIREPKVTQENNLTRDEINKTIKNMKQEASNIIAQIKDDLEKAKNDLHTQLNQTTQEEKQPKENVTEKEAIIEEPKPEPEKVQPENKIQPLDKKEIETDMKKL